MPNPRSGSSTVTNGVSRCNHSINTPRKLHNFSFPCKFVSVLHWHISPDKELWSTYKNSSRITKEVLIYNTYVDKLFRCIKYSTFPVWQSDHAGKTSYFTQPSDRQHVCCTKIVLLYRLKPKTWCFSDFIFRNFVLE